MPNSRKTTRKPVRTRRAKGVNERSATGSTGPASALLRALEASGAARAEVSGPEVAPMLAETAERPFSRRGWLFEIKVDGFRAIAGKQGSDVSITYRRGRDATAIFPDLARALAALPAHDLVLDGEIAVLDPQGRPSFQRLQKRALLVRTQDLAQAARERPAVLLCFDLLAAEGFDLRPLPLSARKALLRLALPAEGPLRLVDAVEEHGEALWERVSAAGLEGIMGKRADAPYQSGRSREWLKVRIAHTADFAVVGFTRSEGGRTGFGALQLAYCEAAEGEGAGGARGGAGDSRANGLVYAGSAGSGFTEKQLREISQALEPDLVEAPPCSGPVPRGGRHAWVRPRLVCEVRYREMTDDGLLRHPVFLRMRPDKQPADCPRPTALPPPADELPARTRAASVAPPRGEPPSGMPPGKAPARNVPANARAARAPPSGAVRKLTFTNLDKPLWPGEGFTKGDLIEYYRAISPWLLPWLRDRPVTITRYPDGIAGKSFFQKKAPDYTPPWIRRTFAWSPREEGAEGAEGAEDHIEAIVCDELDALLFLANLAAIPLHLPASRVASPQRADWCVIDLDPKGAPFAHVVALAQEVHSLCDEIGLPSFCKTSGQAGLHVLIPLGGQCTHDEAKALGELLARIVESRQRTISTTARPIAQRMGRVYLDFLQNGRGKTIAGPYSVRPVPGATASTPLRWDEVDSHLDPRAFTLRTLPVRARALGADPLSPVLQLSPDLPAALSALARKLLKASRY